MMEPVSVVPLVIIIIYRSAFVSNEKKTLFFNLIIYYTRFVHRRYSEFREGRKNLFILHITAHALHII